ncbi:hypothetical protein [Gemmata sp.]|uniref:hypothetical protein n=1 Tax=Gemmata sp. TaxID=1914242 RepID=UPI003F71929F
MSRSHQSTPKTQQPSNPTTVPVVGLVAVQGLEAVASAAPGAEPPREELVPELRAGRQPYPLVVAGTTVIFGTALLAAAKAIGAKSIVVETVAEFAKTPPGDLLFRAAGLYLRAAETRTEPETFRRRLLVAGLYQACTGHRQRKKPAQAGRGKGAELRAKRSQLVFEVFGRRPRSLERDLVLIHLPPAVPDAVRLRRLPERDIEAVANLTLEEQLRLVGLLARGTPFAEARDEILGPTDGRHKSPRGVRQAISKSIQSVAREARGREDTIALRADEYPDARYVHGLLERWLAVPPPVESIDDLVRGVVDDVRGRADQRGAGSAATRGGRGAAGGTP